MTQTAYTRLAKVSMVALCVGMASACTTASDHTEAIKKFADATGSVKDAMVAYDQAAAERATQMVRAKAVAQKKGLDGASGPGFFVAPEDCQSNSTECAAFFAATREDRENLTQVEIIPNHVKAAKAMASYADALKAVAVADSRAQVKGALDQAAAATSAFANAAAPGAGAAAQPLAGATANALAWLYGRYQEKVKINALREATQRMNPVVQAAVQTLGQAASLVDQTSRDFSAEAVDMAKTAFDMNPSMSAINDLAASVNSYSNQLKASPASVFTQLAVSHQQLTDALVDGPESLEDVFASISALADDAEQLAAIAMQFKAAAEAKSTAMTTQ